MSFRASRDAGVSGSEIGKRFDLLRPRLARRRQLVDHLGTDHDVNAIVKAIEAARELGRQSAFDQMREAEVVPASRQDMVDLAKTASGSFGHAVGTAKLGADADAVVDGKLRVHGLRGLRVADASVMPFILPNDYWATLIVENVSEGGTFTNRAVGDLTVQRGLFDVLP